MKNLFLCVVVLFVSCTTEGTKNVCSCTNSQKLEVAHKIQISLKDSNNYSDEEMEDVIKQLEQTYVRLICNQKTVFGYYKDGWFTPTEKSDSLTFYQY